MSFSNAEYDSSLAGKIYIGKVCCSIVEFISRPKISYIAAYCK